MLEIRSISTTEVRAAGGSGDADPLRIEGYASVFNQPAQLPDFREVIKPGAFTRSVSQGADVVCLFNHDPNQVLGRTKNGTLRLRQDAKGLHYTCDLPNTQHARDLHTSIARGDISECSFAFKIPDGGQEWTEERDADGTYFVQRAISDVTVKDVSPVTYPAYSGTNVSARSCAEVPVELRSAVDAKNAALVTPPAAASQSVDEKNAKPAEVRMKDFEKRSVIDSIADQISYQDAIGAVASALAKKFPYVPADGQSGFCGYGEGKFWTIDTYDDFVIVCECGEGNKFAIAYAYVGDDIEFGTPLAVEETYVPSARAAKSLFEFRIAKAAFEKRSVCPDCGFDNCDCDLEDMLEDDFDENSLKDKDCAKMRARVDASKLNDDQKGVVRGKIAKAESGYRSEYGDKLHKAMGY